MKTLVTAGPEDARKRKKKNGTLIRKRYSLYPSNRKIVQSCIRIHCVIENEGIQF